MSKQGKVIKQSPAAKSPKAPKRGRVPVIGQVNVARITLRSQDMSNWQAAINQARNELMPRRRALYELYDNLTLDAHLHAVLTKRTTNVANKRIEWVQDGASDELLDRIYAEIIDTPWFHDFIIHSMSVVPYGTTLIELVPEAGRIGRCEVVPRANVMPERGWIAQDALNIDSPFIYYRDDPQYSTYLIEVGKPKDLGALVIALPYLLWKRGGFADFAQFSELFGMPFRVGTYDPYDESTRQKLNTALSEMGGAGYAVIPDGTKIDFQSTSATGTQSTIYKDLVELCNAEMSKLFLGNTLTTEQGDKGARSLGEVHQGVEHDIALADMRRIEFLLNWELKDRLAALGYPVSDGYFRFDMSVGLPIEKRIEVDIKVAQQVDVPESYWRETYGIPAPNAQDLKAAKDKKAAKEKSDPPTQEKKEEGDKDDEDDRGDTALRRELDKLYKPHRHTHGTGFTAADGPDEDSDPIMEELARAMHDGRIKEGHIDPKLMQWTADQLTRAVMGGDDIAEEGGPQSNQVQDMMRDNVMVFSGFKTYHTLRAATNELLDEDGQFRSFADFRKRITAIDQTYNRDYLRAEYQHAIASAQMAERWADIQQDKDTFPFLRYSTAGDERVRPDHAALDGVIKPVDDAFWDTHMPPNGWNCRCDVEQATSDEGGRELPPNYTDERQSMWKNNVGKTGVVFPQGHPYYSAPKEVAKAVEDEVKKMKPKRAAMKSGEAQPLGTPVSAALRAETKPLRVVMERTLAAIDRVHGDGRLSPLQVNSFSSSKSFGQYRHTRSGAAYDIRISTKSDHKHLTLAHEVGHWIDHIGMGRGTLFGTGRTLATPEMKAVQEAMGNSSAIKQITDALQRRTVIDETGKEVRLVGKLHDFYEYLADPPEQWARAYSQYIALRSGDEVLLKELRESVAKQRRPMQWSDDDFAPIAAAIDKLFISRKWRTQ